LREDMKGKMTYYYVPHVNVGFNNEN